MINFFKIDFPSNSSFETKFFKDITIISGPNGCGKTYLLHEIAKIVAKQNKTTPFVITSGMRLLAPINSNVAAIIKENFNIDILKIYSHELSSGLSMLCALIYYTIKNDNDVVLIDDLGDNLHIDIQEKILNVLLKIAPKKQFIITTHHPMIISGYHDRVVVMPPNPKYK